MARAEQGQGGPDPGGWGTGAAPRGPEAEAAEVPVPAPRLLPAPEVRLKRRAQGIWEEVDAVVRSAEGREGGGGGKGRQRQCRACQGEEAAAPEGKQRRAGGRPCAGEVRRREHRST